MASKTLTGVQAETAKKRAASFVRSVLKDEDRADEIEGEGLEEWADETGRTITNPKILRRKNMAQAKPSKIELQDTLDQVEDMISDALDPALTREEVIEKLQEIDSLISGDDDDEDGEDDDDNGYYDPN